MCGSDDKTDESEERETVPSSRVDVSYFRNLIQTETDRLTVLCAVWRSTMDDVSELSDEGNCPVSAGSCSRYSLSESSEDCVKSNGMMSSLQFVAV